MGGLIKPVATSPKDPQRRRPALEPKPTGPDSAPAAMIVPPAQGRRQGPRDRYRRLTCEPLAAKTLLAVGRLYRSTDADDLSVK